MALVSGGDPLEYTELSEVGRETSGKFGDGFLWKQFGVCPPPKLGDKKNKPLKMRKKQQLHRYRGVWIFWIPSLCFEREQFFFWSYHEVPFFTTRLCVASGCKGKISFFSNWVRDSWRQRTKIEKLGEHVVYLGPLGRIFKALTVGWNMVASQLFF